MRTMPIRKQNKRRPKTNSTLDYMRTSQMRFKRRLDIQMWHVDHLRKTCEHLSELVEELERLRGHNGLKDTDKCMYAQTAITITNKKLAVMLPKDPRERGAERLEYTDTGLVDTNGHDELLASDDLNRDQGTMHYASYIKKRHY